MSLSLADQYYAKALDEYPYNLEDFVENLTYALSYDADHVGANSLMARFYQEKMRDMAKAEFHYQAALSSDPANSRVCLDFALLYIVNQEFEKADKLLKYAQQLKGTEMAMWFRLKGLYFEYQKDYKRAKKNFKKAIFEAMDGEIIEFLKGESDRVETKIKLKKPGKMKKPAKDLKLWLKKHKK